MVVIVRFACVLIPNMAVQLAVAADPDLYGQPVVIGGQAFEPTPVCDASPQAIAGGVKVGMPLHQAYALCPQARFLPYDGKAVSEAFDKVADILEEGFSPVVDTEELGCAYLDVSGIRSERNLASEILAAISIDTRLSACLGISTGKFFSRVAAITSRPEAPVLVLGGKEKEFIAPFSIDFLPCSAETKERLKLLGLRFIGELSQFSREALAAQFGSDGILVYELASGIDRTLLTPRKKPEVISDGAELDLPEASYIEILQCCRTLLERLLTIVKAQGKVCREVLLKISFAAGNPWQKIFPLKQATSSADVILARIQIWLETTRFPALATEVRLSLWLTTETGRRLHLLPEQMARQELARAANELRLRFNYQPLKKIEEAKPSPILPERRFRLIDMD